MRRNNGRAGEYNDAGATGHLRRVIHQWAPPGSTAPLSLSHHITMLPALAILSLVLQGPLQQQQPPSPIARLVVTPAQRTVTAGDTLRLSIEAFDAQGRRIENALTRFMAAGGSFEGDVSPDGLVFAGSTGVLPINVLAMVEGSRPVVDRVEVKMVPGPAARVEITPPPARLVVGQRVRAEAKSWSAAGDVRNDRFTWESSMPAVARVDEHGMITALAPGRTRISATAGTASASVPVEIVANTIASVEITPARPTARQGDVIRFKAVPKDARGRVIAGLTPTWSFSPGHGVITQDGAFVGYERGDYVVTARFGGRSADALVRLEHRDVRRPVTVVGRLPRTRFNTEEVWVHPNGRYAYLGTGGGGDRLYVIDISNPANPVVTDSLMANTRRVNDVMTTPDGKFLVHTREGADNRRNGIVIASLEDPAHPKVISEFTEGVTAGVHSAFIAHQPKFGTHIYLTNNGTNALHIVDISDPYKPKEVAQFRTQSLFSGGSLHDVDVQDGLAYLSYWNDNLVVLDVGNGIKGGSPSNPVQVSQYKYDLEELYRDVAAVGGPGFIRGTHTAWRHKDYVFISDEVFPARSPTGTKDESANRQYGRMQVIDVSDIENPRSVAWYEPEMGGVHNIWVAGDTLYMGAYSGGFRAFDISGELLGDLGAQKREIAHLPTADLDGVVRNSVMTWGVVVKDGLAYVNDMHNGLWIVRIDPKSELVP